MNAGAARACRADRKLSGRTGKIPRDFKRAWAAMTHRERGRLRRHWRAAQHDLAIVGQFKHDLKRSAADATVKPADLKL